MFKNRQSINTPAKQTKHEQEMAALRAFHERVLKDDALREAILVGSGVFVRTAGGELAVAKPYDKVIVSKRAPD
jgi:hypothetical protein